MIIGLVGPSGVGKGYLKQALLSTFPHQFSEPIVVTTRPKRPTDGIDRMAGIKVHAFLKMSSSGLVIFSHQPFGPKGDWYGFLAESLAKQNLILTEVHVQNVYPFSATFGKHLLLIGIVGDREYLRTNLEHRGTESHSQKQERLETSMSEVEAIRAFHSNDIVTEVLEVTKQNKTVASELLIAIILRHVPDLKFS